MKIKFYHVVTERPMKVGQEIVFDEEHMNGVATRINRVIELEKMSITDNSNVEGFDEVVLDNLSYWMCVANREVTLENIRKSLGRETYQIVEVETNGNSFTGDANNCWYECPSNKEARERAVHYWKNGENVKDEKPIYETIIDGRIVVTKIIKDFRSI